MAKIPDSAEKPVTQQHLDSPVPDSKSAARVSSSGVTLVPRPSDDPKDPLVCPPIIYLAHHLNAIQELVNFQEIHYHGYLVSWCIRQYRFGLG